MSENKKQQGGLPRFIANPDEFQTSILHAMYRCAQRGESVERMHFDVCQIIAASQQAAEPVRVLDYGYTDLFNAIAEATESYGEKRIGVSVTKFREYLASRPATAIQQPQDGRAAIEEAAKAIYPLLPGNAQGSPIDHPWQEGGNSNMQDLARRMARAALAKKGGAA